MSACLRCVCTTSGERSRKNARAPPSARTSQRVLSPSVATCTPAEESLSTVPFAAFGNSDSTSISIPALPAAEPIAANDSSAPPAWSEWITWQTRSVAWIGRSATELGAPIRVEIGQSLALAFDKPDHVATPQGDGVVSRGPTQSPSDGLLQQLFVPSPFPEHREEDEELQCGTIVILSAEVAAEECLVERRNMLPKQSTMRESLNVERLQIDHQLRQVAVDRAWCRMRVQKPDPEILRDEDVGAGQVAMQAPVGNDGISHLRLQARDQLAQVVDAGGFCCGYALLDEIEIVGERAPCLVADYRALGWSPHFVVKQSKDPARALEYDLDVPPVVPGKQDAGVADASAHRIGA